MGGRQRASYDAVKNQLFGAKRYLALLCLSGSVVACAHQPPPQTFTLHGLIVTEIDMIVGGHIVWRAAGETVVGGHTIRGPAGVPVTGSLMLSETEDTITFHYSKATCTGSSEPTSHPDVFQMPVHCSNGQSGTAESLSYRCGQKAVDDAVKIHLDDGSFGDADYKVIDGPCAPILVINHRDVSDFQA